MKKMRVILLVLAVMLMSACSGREIISGREIVRRKENVITAPFDKEKIEEGSYTINLYKIDYPRELKGKQEFYANLNVVFKKFYLAEKKLNMLVDKEYYEDYKTLEEESLLTEESILDKPASTLESYEINLLRDMVSVEVDKYRGTVQEYLNLQVAYLMDFLGEGDKFDKDYLYTEREKNEYVDMLKEIRRENFKFLSSLDIEMVLEVEDPYSDNTVLEEGAYWNEKDIILATTSKYKGELSSYSIPLYIKNIKEKDIDNLIKGLDSIDNKVIILENSIYHGYTHKNNFIFFTGGEKLIKKYDKYDIEVEIKELKLKELLKVDEKLLISDFTGGNN